MDVTLSKAEKETDNLRNSLMAIKAMQKQSCADEDIAKAFQLGLALGLGEIHNEVDKLIGEIKKSIIPQQKMGQWLNDKCSECGKGIEDLIDSPEWYRNEEPNFCPYCGIKMEKIEDDRR